MSLNKGTPHPKNWWGSISHAADFYRRYPGETVIFFTRVEIAGECLQFRVRITLPPGFVFIDAKSLNQPAGTIPLISQDDAGVVHLIWDVDRERGDTELYEVRIEARVAPTPEDRSLESRAILTSGEDETLEESIRVSVQAKGSYLKYLPNIYQEDEMMGRFLMLFESFLAPIDQQIAAQPNYYDPKLTPPDFLPWLASWFGIALDHDLPESNRRMLLKESATLFRKRGTRQSLERYLEISTGGRVEIKEHFSENFSLGPHSFLGPGIALGKDNIPNTFSVSVELPPANPELSKAERKQQAQFIQHKIISILDTEKPAHAGYDLHLKIGSDNIG